MSKTVVKINLGTSKTKPKSFWNECVRDAERKLVRAKKRVEELEEARATFARNAAQGMPIPGEFRRMAGTDSAAVPAKG